MTTHNHAGEPLLLFHDIVDISRDKGFHLIKVVLFAFLALRLGVGLGWIRHELLQELNSGVDQWGSLGTILLRTDNRSSQVLAQLREQTVERRTVDENLEDGVGEAHVTGVDESTRMNLRRRRGACGTDIEQIQ